MTFRLLFGVSLAVLLDVCLADPLMGGPLVIPSSNQWDGIDGPWSTFDIGIGDPNARPLRCLPGFSLGVVVLPVESQLCNKNSSHACPDRSNYTRPSFSIGNRARNSSTDWDYNLSLNWDRTTATNTDSKDSDIYLQASKFRVPRRIIETNSLDFSVGIFGLSTGTDSRGSTTSLLSQLATSEFIRIPSNSFSYTAGSIKKNRKGSLIFGGYDTSQIKVGTTIQGKIAASYNSIITIDLDGIYVNSTWSASWISPGSQPITFLIDSTLPHIWLPLEACAMFERAFGLTWNADLELYLVEDTRHAELLQENPSVTFLLGSQPGIPSQPITLSYASFDLQLSPPLVEKNTSYFPIRRASEPNSYMLGRAFLQETYITVDYERSTFNLSAVEDYPVPGGTILPIPKKDDTQGGGELSAGAYAGIGVGVAVFVLVVAGSVFFCWRKRSRRAHNIDARPRTPDQAELHDKYKEVPLSMVHGCMELPEKNVVEVMEREPGELEAMQRGARRTEERNPDVNAVRSPIMSSSALPRGHRNSW